MKGDIAGISAESGPLTASGDLLKVDWDSNNQGLNGTYGTGASSGNTIGDASGEISGSDTASNGVRIMRSYPVFEKLAVPSTALVNGVMDVYRFSLKAEPSNSNGLGLTKITLNVSTSTGSSVSGTTTLTSVEVFAYTKSDFTGPVSGYTNGQVVATVSGLTSSGDNNLSLSSILQIPSGKTYYFKVTGTATLTSGTGTFSGSITSRISGDSVYPASALTSGYMMATSTAVDDHTDDNFIWSPNSTTTATANDVDWTNGFNIPGLPSGGSDSVTISK